MDKNEYKIKAIFEYYEMLAECDEAIEHLYADLKAECENRREITMHILSLVKDVVADPSIFHLTIGEYDVKIKATDKDSQTVYTKAFLNNLSILLQNRVNSHWEKEAHEEGEQIFKALEEAGYYGDNVITG